MDVLYEIHEQFNRVSVTTHKTRYIANLDVELHKQLKSN